MKSGEIVPGRRVALGMQSEKPVDQERVVLCVLFEGDQRCVFASVGVHEKLMEQVSFLSGVENGAHPLLLSESREVLCCTLRQRQIERV